MHAESPDQPLCCLATQVSRAVCRIVLRRLADGQMVVAHNSTVKTTQVDLYAASSSPRNSASHLAQATFVQYTA